jgi:hypothetical protein
MRAVMRTLLSVNGNWFVCIEAIDIILNLLHSGFKLVIALISGDLKSKATITVPEWRSSSPHV